MSIPAERREAVAVDRHPRQQGGGTRAGGRAAPAGGAGRAARLPRSPAPRRAPGERADPGRGALFLDRDGVLNRYLPGAYVTHWALFEWLPSALQALREAHANGWPVVIVTNQAGVGRGLQTQPELDAVHLRLRDEAAAAGGAITAVYACPHRPDEGCACRKPRPGLILRAAADLGIDLGRSWLVGDADTDAQAAEAAGVRWLLVRTGRGAETAGALLPAAGGAVCADVLEAVRRLGRYPGPP